MNAPAEARAAALRGLTAEDRNERLAALEHFRGALWDRQLVKKDPMAAIARAVDDADPDVALTAARAVLAQRWRYGDMDRILGALEADLARTPSLADKLIALARRIDDPKVLELLAPWLIARLDSASAEDRAVARTGLANLAHGGTNLGPAVPGLVHALADAVPDEREAWVELLYIAAGNGADTRAAEPLVEGFFSKAEDDVAATLRYRAARLATVGRFVRAEDGLSALTRHADPAVREGAVDALGAVRRWDGFAARGVSLLAERLDDEAGGVMQGAAQSLALAAADGVDLAAAYAAMHAAIAEGREYRAEGRVFVLDGSGYSDLRRSDLVADLSAALVRSSVKHGQLDVLASDLGEGRARRGAAQALASLEQDPALIATVAAARSLMGIAADSL